MVFNILFSSLCCSEKFLKKIVSQTRNIPLSCTYKSAIKVKIYAHLVFRDKNNKENPLQKLFVSEWMSIRNIYNTVYKSQEVYASISENRYNFYLQTIVFPGYGCCHYTWKCLKWFPHSHSHRLSYLEKKKKNKCR